MLKRIILVVIFVPLAIVLIALAIANRGMTPFTLDPFNPGDPALTLQLPLFVWLFLALGAGVLIGGFAAWARQGRYRRLARLNGREAGRLREEVRAGTPKPVLAEAPVRASAAALPKPAR